MKKFFLAIGLLAAMLLQASAVTVVFTVPSGSAWNSTNFFTLSTRINSITINTGAAGGATNLTYALIDAPTSAPAYGWGPIKQTNAAYIQVSQYLTNMTKITTNFSGLLITNVASNVVVSYTNTVAAGSNDWRRVVVGTVDSNSSSTITGPFNVIYGLGFTNNSIGVGATVTVDYDPSL